MSELALEFIPETASAHDVLPLVARADEIAHLLAGDSATDELRVEHEEIMAKLRAWNQAHQVFPMTADAFPDFQSRDLGWSA